MSFLDLNIVGFKKGVVDLLALYKGSEKIFPFEVPATPVVFADDELNTVWVTHALGIAEIEVSINGASCVPYIDVPGYSAIDDKILDGNVARAQGYYKFRVKVAPGRNASLFSESPAFTVSAVDQTQYSDVDADVYLTAANIQPATPYTDKAILGLRIQNAVRRLAYKSKASGIYNKFKGLWLSNSGSNSDLINAVTPGVKDLVSAVGAAPTFSAKGIYIPPGAKLDTGFKLSDLAGITLGIYIQDVSLDVGDYQAGYFDGTHGFGLGLPNYLVKGSNINGTADGLQTVNGLTTLNIAPDHSSYSIFVNGVKVKSGVPSATNTALNVFIGGLNYVANQASFQRSGHRPVIFMADYFTDAENQSAWPIIEEYCLDMIRGITKRFYFLGDSIVFGANSTYQSTRWTSQVSGYLLLTEINRGIGGSKTSDWVNTAGLANIPNYVVGDIGLLIALNTNDCAQGVPTATVKANMITILSNAKAKGWPVEKICVNLGYHDTVVTQAVKDTYIQATLEACQDQLIPADNCVDMKAIMLANGGDALIDPDTFHPTQSGHNVIANGWIPVIESLIV